MMKFFRRLFLRFAFPFFFESRPRDAEMTATILLGAYTVDGFKELLANDVYYYKRKAIESKGLDMEAIFHAEAYQRLLDKMARSREFITELHRKRGVTQNQ